MTCNMKLKCGGVEGGWMQVVDTDMNRMMTLVQGPGKMSSIPESFAWDLLMLDVLL